jgi:uncharacterized protein YprB with RNaseH-like and TPR domain
MLRAGSSRTWKRFFACPRNVAKYKKSIFQIYDDWKDPKYRQRVLQYNADDVKNLVLLKKKIFERYDISRDFLQSITLK